MDPLEKVPESASEAVLESVTDIRCGSGQEEEDILNLTETDPKSAQEPVLQSVSDVRTERLYEEQATTDCSNEEKDEATAEQMEVAVPETPLKSGSQSEPDVHSGSEQGKEDNLDSADPVPESASEPGLESVTDIRCGSRQEEVDNLNQPETNPESAPEPVTDIPSGSGQEEENLNLSEAERSHEEQATADLSEQPKEEKTLDPMEVEPEAPLNQRIILQRT
uniref:Uncharacterized protein n=1 Tax=Anopheles minimus TaxID=112268 RepID=A0A182VS06_9DIPT